MPFDPDKYLAGPFDPDKYLSKFDPDKYLGGSSLPPIVSEQEAAQAAARRGGPQIGGEPTSTGNPEVDAHRRHLLGSTEAAINLITGIPAFIGGLAGGAVQSAFNKKPAEENAATIQEKFTYQPRSEAAQEMLKTPYELMNRVGMPLVGHPHMGGTIGRTKKGTPEPIIRDLDRVILEEKAKQNPPVQEKPVTPIPNEAQMELPDSAMIQAPQYGVMEGMSRIDENGMPIKADVSMEAQNLENPLQRNLWGDELPPKSPQEGIPLTQAIDSMEPAYRSPAIWKSGLDAGAMKETPELRAATEEAARIHQPQEGPFSMGEGIGRNQRGGIPVDALAEGFRGLNRWLSKLTDQEWLRKAFGDGRYMSNPDGTPMVLLHGTRNSFEGTPQAFSEGFHAGYAYPANAKTSKGSTNKRPAWRVGNTDFSGDRESQTPAIYPVVIKKGNYPFINEDMGTWDPRTLGNGAQKENFSHLVSKALEGKKTYNEVRETLTDFWDSIKNRPWLTQSDINQVFSEHLKNLGIDGFFYTNHYEDIKSKLNANSGIFPTPQRARNAAKARKNGTSFVTWNDKNIRSIYDRETISENNSGVPVGETRDLGPMSQDLEATFANQHEQLTNDAIAKFLSGGYAGKQRGAIDLKAITDFFTRAEVAPKEAVPHTPVKDTVVNPRSPENIAQKTELRTKAEALKLDAYSRVTTPEEALSLADSKHDMSKIGGNSLRSGSEAVLRTNQKNSVVNFFRTARQNAVNLFESKSKEFVTGKDGVVAAIKKVNKEDQTIVAEALIKGDREKMVFTDEQLSKIGWTPEQKALYFKIREALDARYAFASEQAGLKGYSAFQPRTGYLPSNFSGSYTKLVGFTDEKGNWVTKGVAQGNTTFELKQAIEKYKEMGKEYSESIDMGFHGIKDNKKNIRNYNGFAEIVARLAELDPQFANAKKIADQHMMDQARSLYNFDVHELKKSGVKGSLGDRPWLTQERNTKELMASIVDYLETGFRYDAYQGFLMDAEKLINEPKIQSEMPNTAEWGRKYLDHIRGNNLNAVGAFVNSLVNTVAEGGSKVRVSTKFLPATISKIQGMSTSMMMAFGNIGFAMMQMLQPVSGGIPEASRIRASTGLSIPDITTSFAMGPIYGSAMILGADHGIPVHIKEAWNWARDRGIVDFSEAELAHNLQKSKARVVTQKIIDAPIIYPEKATRMPVFLAFDDMFHKAGYSGEEAHLRAQAATDYAMANYHSDERPQIYARMGEAGKLLGALSTYKHNLVEQNMSSAMNIAKNKEAALAMATVAFTMYGVSGLPGYGDVDKLVKAISGKNIREIVLSKPRNKNLAMDGLISYQTDEDFQSRLSMSSVLPDPQHPLSVAPHIQNFWNVTSAAYEAAKNRDKASLQQLVMKALPSSMRNIYETEILTTRNDKGENFVKNALGYNATETPRTDKETKYRAVLGLRPLRERLNSETTWTDSQRELQRTKDMKDARIHFDAALRLSDIKGMSKWADKYLELGGDIKNLYSNTHVKTVEVESAKTPKQRAEGTVHNNLNSIRRYETFNQGHE
jgi:hypothetical protein